MSHPHEHHPAGASDAIRTLRRNLAIHEEQHLLIAHARALQTELRFHAGELQRQSASWAVEERALVLARLAALDEIFSEGSIVLSPARKAELVAWLDA